MALIPFQKLLTQHKTSRASGKIKPMNSISFQFRKSFNALKFVATNTTGYMQHSYIVAILLLNRMPFVAQTYQYYYYQMPCNVAISLGLELE